MAIPLGSTCSWPGCEQRATSRGQTKKDGSTQDYWCHLHYFVDRARLSSDSTASKAPVSQQGRTTGSLNSLEQTLFANSAYSNPFWSDSVDEEDPELIRAEMGRRLQAHEDASKRLSELKPGGRATGLLGAITVVSCFSFAGAALPLMAATLVLGLIVAGLSSGPRRIVRAGLVYPSETLWDRSVARYEGWAAELSTKDPHHYASIVAWVQQEELRAERERQHQEAVQQSQRQHQEAMQQSQRQHQEAMQYEQDQARRADRERKERQRRDDQNRGGGMGDYTGWSD